MLTPFAKLVLAGLFIVAAVALIVIRLVKWMRSRSGAASQPKAVPVARYRGAAYENGLQPQADDSMATPFSRPTPAVADPTPAAPPQPKPQPLPLQPLKADVPMAKPLDSSSILVGAGQAAKTNVASTFTATKSSRPAFLDDVPDLPDIDASDIPHYGTEDYRYGESATKALAAMLPESQSKKHLLKQELVNAGEYEPHAYDNFRAMRAIGVFGSVLACLAALLFVPSRLEWLPILGLVVLPIIFWALPTVLMRSKAAERRREIENGMPDMLDLLGMCVSQGMTVPSALGRVATELKPVYPALSKELTITGTQAKIGSLESAMRGLGKRVDIPEIHSFTSLMSQTEQMGTSVSESLEVYSDNFRENLRQRADQKANTAAFKLLFPTVLFLLPAVFLFLLGPALLDIADFFNSGTAEGVLSGNSASGLSGISVER